MSDFWQLCCEYGRYYCDAIIEFWKHLRPATYASALFLVWLVGFALLKSGGKRP